MKHKIDFLVIGAQKSGTTTIYDWLSQHSNIFLPEIKENPYFADDKLYRHGVRYLDVLYKKYSNQKIIGGAYVNLMYFPYVIDRIRDYNPRMKFIVALRNPINRAYSAYWYFRSNGLEECDTFEKALELEKERITGSFTEQADFTYIEHGKYADQLKYYLSAFGPEQLLSFFSDELRSNPEEVLGRVLKFLNLDNQTADFNLSRDSNSAHKPRFPAFQKFLFSRDNWYKQLYLRVLPNSVRMMIKKTITQKIISWNRSRFQYPPMNPDTRRMLVEFYKPYNAQLKKLIGTYPVSWDQ